MSCIIERIICEMVNILNIIHDSRNVMSESRRDMKSNFFALSLKSSQQYFHLSKEIFQK